MSTEDWQDQGLCAQTDPEAFFPEKGQSNTAAKKICAACEVTAECLAYALARDEWGVWGGLTQKERTALRHTQPAARAA